MSDQDGRSGVSYKCYNCDDVFLSKAQSNKVACPKCGNNLVRWRARVNYVGTITLVKRLAREGPIVGESRPSHLSESRRVAHVLPVPRNTAQAVTRPGNMTAKQVLYLPGQERAAVTAFIDANTEFVASCLDSDTTGDAIKQKWPDDLYQLLIEQWYWTGHGEMHVKRRNNA